MTAEMPTLDGEREPQRGVLATHHDGKTPLSERFRRAKLRESMFGDAGETLTIGRYEVTGKIGIGAMGTVYRAKDTALDREVAIKVLHRGDEADASRMAIEAKALAKLSHPNVVTVHEVGTDDGQLFVAMEYVRGKTLNLWLEDATSEEMLDVFAQAAEGLQAAHDAGIVHRDFKPENVIVGDDGRVRVLDFGLARSSGATLVDEVDETSLQNMDQPALTRTGVLAGTPSYMAPEQFRGGRVDAAADQFAFCIALHEAIWGVRPFAGDTIPDLARNVLNGQLDLAPQRSLRVRVRVVAKALERVVERGLRLDPGKRHISMHALATALREASSSHAPRKSWTKWVMGSSVFGLVALSTTAALKADDGPQTQDVAQQASAEAAQPSTEQASNPPEEKLVSPFSSDAPLVSPFSSDAPLVSPFPSNARGTKGCGLGTVERDGVCHPVDWNPLMAACNEDGCAVSRELFRDHGDQPAVLLSQGRLVPFSQEGKNVGLKVFGVRPGTVPAQVGFQTGDVLTTLNGISLVRELDAATKLVGDDLEKTEALAVEYLRKGEAQTVHIRLLDTQ